MILTIKDHYFCLLCYKSPIESSLYLSSSLADLTDPHFALFVKNQHLLQLSVYEHYKKFMRAAHCMEEQAGLNVIGYHICEVTDDRSRLLIAKES